MGALISFACCTSSCKLSHTAGGYRHYYQSKIRSKALQRRAGVLLIIHHKQSPAGFRRSECDWTVALCKWTWCLLDGVWGHSASIWIPNLYILSPETPSAALCSDTLCLPVLPCFSPLASPLKSGFLDSLSSPTRVIRSFFFSPRGGLRAHPATLQCSVKKKWDIDVTQAFSVTVEERKQYRLLLLLLH